MDYMNEIADKLIAGEVTTVCTLTKEALAMKEGAQQILNQGLIGGMDIVAEKFKNDEMFLPEVMQCAQAFLSAMEVLEPELAKANIKPVAKVAIGTVQSDIHNIGKNLVGIMLRGAGFEVIDLGVDVSPDKFVSIAKKEKVQLVCISALLTTTMHFMKVTIEALKVDGFNSELKTMIGGAVVTQRYADEIGADGYAPDAAAAVVKARELLDIHAPKARPIE